MLRLTIAVLLGVCSLFAETPKARTPLTQTDGYTIDCDTGAVFSVDSIKQDFTFACGTVTGQPDMRTGVSLVQPLNPLQYATQATAEKVLAFMKEIAPHENISPYSIMPYGPYSFTSPMRCLMINGEVYNAGLIGAELMQVGRSFTAKALLASIELAKMAKK